MSSLGKILAVLNVLAAIGFLAVAGLDWGKKQVWADAFQQRELLLNGLPVDANDKDKEGRPRADDLRKSVVNELFQKAGGNPVRTQDDEVKKVKDRVQAQVDSPNGKKADKLIDVLWYLATTEDERQRLLDLRTAPIRDTDVLQSQLNQAFDWVNQAPQGATFRDSFKKTEPAQLPPDDKRHRIASLLFRLTPYLAKEENPAPKDLLESQAYNRYIAVVGFAAAARAVDERAQALRRFYDDTAAAIDRDRDAFVQEQRTLLAQLEDIRGRVEDQKRHLRDENGLLAKEKAVVADRKQILTRLDNELAAAREETKNQLAVQEKMEKQLFQSRKNFRNAFDKNEELERQIRGLEKGR